MFWGKYTSANMPIKFGDGQLSIMSETKHMGVVLSARNGASKIYADIISAGRSALFAVRGLGRFSVPIAPKVLTKLYWSVSVLECFAMGKINI